MGKYYRQYKKVGKITTSLTKKLNCAIQRSVYASPGVINHIRKYHSKQLSKNVKENLYRTIENIIENNTGAYLLHVLIPFPSVICKNNINPIIPTIIPDNKCNILSYIGIIS